MTGVQTCALPICYRAAVAFGVALIVFLAGGLYLGGHPSKLPTWARETFTEEPTSLVGEASEIIKDNYFRKVGNTELGKAMSDAHMQVYGWVNGGGNLSTNSVTPGGNNVRRWPISASTSSATCTVLLEGWRAMFNRTAGLPLARTMV